MPRLLFATLLSASLTGCALFQEGSASVIKYDDGQPPREVPAPTTDTYSLYGARDIEPELTVQLSKGDVLGFRRNDDTGQVVAVAGSKEWLLADSGDYYWRRR